MRKFLLVKAVILLFTLTVTQATWAQDEQEEVECLAVAYVDGETDYFALDASPVVTFGDGTFSVVQDGEDAYSLEDVSLDDVQEYNFQEAVPTEAVPEGIGKISAGEALMTGLKEGAQVYVYTIDGQTIVSTTAGKDGVVNVDLNSLKGGQVYILRTPKASYKIVK